MIITRAPLRIGLLGGGSDLRSYYAHSPGLCLNAAIDKYVFAIVKRRFDDMIYVNYSRKEIVATVDDLGHDLVREAMRRTGVRGGVEVTTLADVPAEGTGLGSSSAILVALLQAFYVYQGHLPSRQQLAEEACAIEIDVLGRPIGKQDQYASAFGGLRVYEFRADESVAIDSIVLAGATLRRLENHLMLLYTGQQRRSGVVLSEQNQRAEENFASLTGLCDLAREACAALTSGMVDELGRLLDAAWRLKKGLASGVSNDAIDEMYQRALAAGALGGKVTGAGGGGFLLLYCPPERQDAVRTALGTPRELNIVIDPQGSRVIFDGGD
ncbi:MAG: GHMP kinase [Chloroflexi bacterium]|nr:GHMP kinase [Chloroflexota bacterium]